MKELVEYIVQTIVTNPDDVRVTEVEQDGQVVLRVEVAPEDKGKVIGREGRVAHAIRLLLRVAAVKKDTHVILEII